MYRLIPLRALRKTTGIKIDEISSSDFPIIDGINKIVHSPNSISPGPLKNVTRPWYRHRGQNDNLLLLHGKRYIDLYDSKLDKKISLIITPDKIYNNDELLYDGPAIINWSSGTFHRIASGNDGSISINLVTRKKNFNYIEDINIYDLDTETGIFKCISDGYIDKWNTRKDHYKLIKNNGHLESDKIGTLEMFNNQYYLDYKEFKRRAAAERSSQ